MMLAWTDNQSINQLISFYFALYKERKKTQHNNIIENITVRAGETPKKTAIHAGCVWRHLVIILVP